MGAWGVKATESDYGLDLLRIVEKRHLMEHDYKRFCVREVLELLNEHILDEIRYANRGCPKENMDLYIEITAPGRYEQAAILIAECLVKYLRKGKYVIPVITEGKSKPTRKKITDFVYTVDDLNDLLECLRIALTPGSHSYCMWEEGEYLHEWQSHVESLCDCLQNQIDGKNG